MARNTPRGTPARILILFGMLIAAVTLFTWRQAASGLDGISVSFPTGAGDATYHKPGGPPLELLIRGQAWRLVETTTKPLKRRDDRMHALPVSLPGNRRLYAKQAKLPEGKVPAVYLKLGPSEYRRMRLLPQSAEKPTLRAIVVPE